MGYVESVLNNATLTIQKRMTLGTKETKNKERVATLQLWVESIINRIFVEI